jgi:hypothetical protein
MSLNSSVVSNLPQGLRLTCNTLGDIWPGVDPQQVNAQKISLDWLEFLKTLRLIYARGAGEIHAGVGPPLLSQTRGIARNQSQRSEERMFVN